MICNLTAAQSAAIETIVRDVLAIASPGELALVEANLRELRNHPEAYYTSQQVEAELAGFGAADAMLLLPALLKLVSSLALGFTMKLGEGFSQKLGQDLAAWAGASLKNKSHTDEFLGMSRRASRALRKECLRRGCGEQQSKRAAEALEQLMRTSPALFATLAAGRRE
jgi:hypothetical protein